MTEAQKINLQVRMRQSTRDRLRAMAEKEKRGLSDFVRLLIAEGMERREVMPSPVHAVVQEAWVDEPVAVVATLQAKIAEMESDPLASPEDPALPMETDFYGRPLKPGFAKIEGWWAKHWRGGAAEWIGEVDADGNPLMEG